VNRQQRRNAARAARKSGSVGGWTVLRIHRDGREEVAGAGLTERAAAELGEQVRLSLEPGQTVTLRGPLVFDFD